MRALTLHKVKSPLVLEERDSLEPAAHQAVVKVRAAALNRRDYWITQGLYPHITLPIVLGSDGAGTVVRVGSDMDEQWNGREVVIYPGLEWGSNQAAQEDDFTILGLPRDGTFADEVLVDASQLFAKPDYLSWNEAAALPLGGLTAYRAMFTQGELEAGQSVLITGIGGGVATFALQFAVAAGANTWVSSSSENKLAKAVQLGAQGGFDYSEEDWGQQFVNKAGAADLIIDGAGGPSFENLIRIAAPGGRIVNYGATAGKPKDLDLFKIFWKQLRLIGSTMGSPEDFANMLAFVEEHEIKPIVDTVLPLAEGDTAVASMASSPQFGKIVLSTTE